MLLVLVGLELRPAPVRELVREDGDEEDLGHGAGECLVKVRLGWLVSCVLMACGRGSHTHTQMCVYIHERARTLVQESFVRDSGSWGGVKCAYGWSGGSGRIPPAMGEWPHCSLCLKGGISISALSRCVLRLAFISLLFFLFFLGERAAAAVL